MGAQLVDIIDAHIHCGDIYTGRTIEFPLKRPPFGLLTVLEWLRYENPTRLGGRSKPGSDGKEGSLGRLLGDISYMEVCKRVQVSEPEVLMGLARGAGIGRAVVLPVEPFTRGGDTLAVARAHPFFIPFTSPDFTSPDCAHKLRCDLAEGARGLKIHPVLQDIELCDPRVEAALEEFAPSGLPVCIHTGPARNGFVKTRAESYAHPDAIASLARRFPSVPFIMAHMGLIYADTAMDIALRQANMYLETSMQPLRVVRKAVQTTGPGKLIFGSDFPLGNPKVSLDIVRKAVPDKTAQADVLGGTISRLTGLSA